MNAEDWVQMDPEDQWQAFDAMHMAFHEMEHESAAAEGNAGTLIQCMFELATLLDSGNVLGTRRAAMDEVAFKLRLIATKALMAMPDSINTAERVHSNMAFDEIAEQLENDPEFNRDVE